MRVLGIDPGLQTGFCLLDSSVPDWIQTAELGDPRNQCFDRVDHVVIEYPVAYPHSKTNPNDLIKLAIQVGEYSGFYRRLVGAPVTLVKPATWKGQLPKSVTEKRVRAKFPEAAKYLDPLPVSTRHNVSDAIGLAWWLAARLWVSRG
jgi:hypothetical protein